MKPKSGLVDDQMVEQKKMWEKWGDLSDMMF